MTTAQVCFWLMENGLRVLIAGCDTFRAGAVEQLRTHTKHLNSLHPPQEGHSPMVCYIQCIYYIYPSHSVYVTSEERDFVLCQ